MHVHIRRRLIFSARTQIERPLKNARAVMEIVAFWMHFAAIDDALWSKRPARLIFGSESFIASPSQKNACREERQALYLNSHSVAMCQ
jgi:hypothetical protein